MAAEQPPQSITKEEMAAAMGISTEQLDAEIEKAANRAPVHVGPNRAMRRQAAKAARRKGGNRAR